MLDRWTHVGPPRAHAHAVTSQVLSIVCVTRVFVPKRSGERVWVQRVQPVQHGRKVQHDRPHGTLEVHRSTPPVEPAFSHELCEPRCAREGDLQSLGRPTEGRASPLPLLSPRTSLRPLRTAPTWRGQVAFVAVEPVHTTDSIPRRSSGIGGQGVVPQGESAEPVAGWSQSLPSAFHTGQDRPQRSPSGFRHVGTLDPWQAAQRRAQPRSADDDHGAHRRGVPHWTLPNGDSVSSLRAT